MAPVARCFVLLTLPGVHFTIGLDVSSADVSQAGWGGSNGAWPILHASGSISPGSVVLVIAEEARRL